MEGNTGENIPIADVNLGNIERTIELTRQANRRAEETRRNGVSTQELALQHQILMEVVNPNFKMPDLPKYDGTKDPQEHLAAFDLVINLYGQSGPINAKLFVTTLVGKAQEWFTNLPPGSIESNEQLDQRIDMMVSIFFHGLRKGPFASALARDPPVDVEQLMSVAQKYIDEEEMNAMKDGEWRIGSDRGRDPRRDNMWDRPNRLKTPTSRSQERRQEKEIDNRDPRIRENASVKGIIHTIVGGTEIEQSRRSRKRWERSTWSARDRQVANITQEQEIIFGTQDARDKAGSGNDPMVIKLDIANFMVYKVLVDNGSSADITLKEVLTKMGLDNVKLAPVKTPLVGFGGSEVESPGMIDLLVSMGEEPRRKTLMVTFLVVDTPFAYNVILGRPGLNSFRAIVSTFHLKMKFPTPNGVMEVSCDQRKAKRCYNLSLKKGETDKRRKVKKSGEQWENKKIKKEAERIEPIDKHKEIELVRGEPSRTTRIGSGMDRDLEMHMIVFLRNNVDIFAWDPSNFKGINPKVIVHRLNVDPSVRPVLQKRRTFGVEKNQIINEEVKKLLKVDYISEIHYTDWLSNVVVVPKSSRKWRMCTDFTNLNKACPKDPYPLPRIDVLVDSSASYEFFSMMDAYQGYHQIYMAVEDRGKTSFVTEQGIYCYNVMPFGLKNAGATYQRLVNKMFRNHIGKTMEVYVDDMLVKSQRSGDHLSHLEVAFAILR
ncbi:UNVERIFIED_CONTAM: Retrovirus-related Pol polyprotein from transposon gypsy [Sesamum indicum]